MISKSDWWNEYQIKLFLFCNLIRYTLWCVIHHLFFCSFLITEIWIKPALFSKRVFFECWIILRSDRVPIFGRFFFHPFGCMLLLLRRIYTDCESQWIFFVIHRRLSVEGFQGLQRIAGCSKRSIWTKLRNSCLTFIPLADPFRTRGSIIIALLANSAVIFIYVKCWAMGGGLFFGWENHGQQFINNYSRESSWRCSVAWDRFQTCCTKQ